MDNLRLRAAATAQSCGVRTVQSIALFVAATLLTVQVGRADEPTELRLMFVGDTGTGGDSARRVRDVIRKTALSAGASHLFLLGDNVYENGEARYIKPKFIDVYQPVMDLGVTIHAALGNHDVKKCRGTRSPPVRPDATAYVLSSKCWVADHLKTPEFGYQDERRYYVVQIEAAAVPLVDVFVLDSNTLGDEQTKLGNGTDKAQIEWLDKALSESSARWKVIAMHHPIYSPTRRRSSWWSWIPGIGRRDADPRLRKDLEDVLVRHGVDVVFQGHQHLYARLRPQRGGIRYIVSGAGGKRPDTFEPDEHTFERKDRGQFKHFVYVRVTGDSFEYCVLDDKRDVRDGGVFAAGNASADEEFPEGTCPALH